MPILTPEIDVYPADLLDQVASGHAGAGRWWALYSLSRQEKLLMRRLRAIEIPFYTPMIAKRNRSPAGRIRVSHVPLFSNYVFMFGGEEQRRAALATNAVSRSLEAPVHDELTWELQQIRRLIETGAPLLPERRLEAGRPVRIRSGAFKGFEGTIIRRERETRLLVAVNFLRQGVSVLLEDCQLECLN
jgi:transcriptional antiterminator RfaH